MAQAPVPPFDPSHLERIAKVLGDTEHGLTGTQIDQMLLQSRVTAFETGGTKWKRLYNALAGEQNRTRVGDATMRFIHFSLAPARWLANRTQYEHLRKDVNAVLAFRGLEFRDDGKFYPVARVSTLSEAEQRAGRLRARLAERGAHPDVLSACRAELLSDNYFHAVLEACKSVAEKLRAKSRLASDGATLVKDSLQGDDPLLRINAFATDSEKSEQRGFGNLLLGLFGVFRNPTAHAPKVSWPMSEEDALDLFSIASFAHRRLDAATASRARPGV